jgi:ferric-dicitrate binding protein FerR (iron transport regulator)
MRRRSTDPGVRALAVNTAFSFVPPRGGAEIAVLEGLVLVTQAGDPADHVLGRGEALRLPGPGRIAAMALSDARVRVRSLPAAGVAQSPAWNGATCGTSSS